LHDEEKDLQDRVAIQPRVEEDDRVERDHRQPEHIVPDAAQHDQRDIGKAEQERDDFESGHGIER
jgi:hypothetical protein